MSWVRRVSMEKCGVLAGAIAVAVITPRLCLAQQSPQENIFYEGKYRCGGVAGFQCPNGYYCAGMERNVSDAMGVCKKIEIEKLANCLKSRDITVVCSTTYKCKKQRELLGDLFQHLTVRYDDTYTDCKKYGTLCETEYEDVEMVGWIIPKGRPYPLEPANQYPNPTFRGARTMEQIMWLSGCQE
jgi:hypothetical protein